MKKINIITLLLLASIVGTTTVSAVDLPISAKANLNSESNIKTNNNEAKVNSNIKADVKLEASTKAKDKARSEIERRINSLNKMAGKLNSMKRVSDNDKELLHSQISSQISVLNSLDAKIQSDNDGATLKEDIKSITQNYRIFMLVIPQGAIIATSDRVVTTSSMMTTFGNKLETRINQAKEEGYDVAKMEASLNVYTSKVNDANVKAKESIDLVVNLKPDNGDKTVAESNHKILLDARSRTKSAQADLRAARDEAKKIVKELKSINLEAKTNVESSASVQ